MSSRLENRSLDRAITILEVLAQESPCSLQQLYARTALPKSTIRRLLGTLKQRHFVRVGISDGLYRPNIALPFSADREFAVHVARLVEVALPHMVRLTQSVEWPSDLHIHQAGRMHIVESTRSLSPFHIGERKSVDLDVNMFAAAAGLVYLSRLDDADVIVVARAQHDDPRWGLKRIGISETTLLRELAEIRRAGYAVRRAGFNTVATSRPYHAIAVPVSDARHAIGALTLFWPKRYMSTDQFARHYLGALRAAADAISADLARLP